MRLFHRDHIRLICKSRHQGRCLPIQTFSAQAKFTDETAGQEASCAVCVGANLQLSGCGCRACCADGRQRSAQQLAEAEGKLHRIKVKSPNARHLRAEVGSDAAGPLHRGPGGEKHTSLGQVEGTLCCAPAGHPYVWSLRVMLKLCRSRQ